MREIAPGSIRPPFGSYSHGVEVPAGWRMLATSGQLGISSDEAVPFDVEGQARLCFGAILAEAGMGPADIVRVTRYVTDRTDFPDYMRVRDSWLAGTGRRPASTLLVVGGFTRVSGGSRVLAAAP